MDFRKDHKRVIELNEIGRSMASLIMIRHLMAEILRLQKEPEKWMAQVRKRTERTLKGVCQQGQISDEELIFAIDGGLEAVKFVFDMIKIERVRGPAL